MGGWGWMKTLGCHNTNLGTLLVFTQNYSLKILSNNCLSQQLSGEQLIKYDIPEQENFKILSLQDF